MEFNRQNLAVLRQVKRQARQEADFEIHFDSSTLTEDLLELAKTPISAELRALISELVDTSEPVQLPAEVKPARSGSAPLTERLMSSKPVARKRYRGQIVEA